VVIASRGVERGEAVRHEVQALEADGLDEGLELAKLARRRDGQEFDCATWLHKAKILPKEEFQREVEKELTGQDSERWGQPEVLLSGRFFGAAHGEGKISIILPFGFRTRKTSANCQQMSLGRVLPKISMSSIARLLFRPESTLAEQHTNSLFTFLI